MRPGKCKSLALFTENHNVARHLFCDTEGKTKGRNPGIVSEPETEDLRRQVAAMRESLSWKITAPLRFVSKPLFKAMSPQEAEPKPRVEVKRAGAEMEKAVTPGVNGANPTVRALAERYGVSSEFAHGVLEMLVGAGYDTNIGDVEQILERYSGTRIYIDYALSTNTRGQALIPQLRGWGIPVASGFQPPKAYLDIGFAYGGSLAAFARLGYQVTGIEISEKFGRLGRLNLASAGLAVDTRIGDFLRDDVISNEAQFDLITCTDVIEHVMDPESGIRKLCRLLKPGGIAYVAYPTKLSIPYVRADGHSQLFGLTLLDYFRARAAYTMYTGWPEYEVSDFYEPEWYLNTVRSAGASAELIYDSSMQAPDIPGEIAQLYQAFSEWTRGAAQKLDPLMRHEITRELAQYSARMFQEYSRHIAHNSVDLFAQKWIDPLTRILIRKPLT
jgi:2-polyprenyl-3-methyl-5-hydroxy-6-metoxy-1,4-benzoquinol methylase